MKPNLYILNSIEEFEDCKNEITKDDQIIYTSELLGLQLKKIGCEFSYESLFKHLTVDEVNKIKYDCLDRCDEISQKLDSDLANDLKKEFGHSFSVYGPFVNYSSVIIATVQILRKIIDLKKEYFNECILYDRKLANFFESGSYLSDLLCSSYLNYRELKLTSNYKNDYWFKDYFKFKNFIRLYDLIKWRLFILKNNFFNYDFEEHYFIRPLYDSKEYLRDISKNTKLIDFIFLLKKFKSSEVNLCFGIDTDVLKKDIYSNYFTNLSKNINNKKIDLFGRLRSLIKFLENKKVHALSWGNSPCQFSEKSVLISALQQKYNVFGFQHGGSYVDQIYPFHYHSDFMRCTSYHSYSFLKSDLSLYKKEMCDIQVIPFGKKDIISKKKIDKNEILYVPTNSLNLYQGSILRSLPNGLLNVQLEILKKLNNLDIKKLKPNVKPFPGATIDSSFFLLEINKYKNLNYILNTSLKDYFRKRVPGLVIFDLPSTPIYEILSTKAQVILYLDSVNPFTEEALKLLRKRVFICYSMDQIIEYIERYKSNTLEYKYNSEYYSRFVNSRV